MRYFISILIGALVAALGLEVALRWLPVNSGISMAETSPAVPYAHYLPKQPFTYSYGWAMDNRHRSITNEQGFSNSKDLREGANALVIGDSFIESFMLDYPESIQGRLDAALGRVYAASASGNGLADALQLARHFLPQTRAKTVVLFTEPWDMRAIATGSTPGHNHFTFGPDGVGVQHTPYVTPKLRAYLLKSALLRYAYYNLKLPDWIISKGGKPMGAAPMAGAQEVRMRQRRDAALDYLMAELGKLQREYGTRFVFLVDSDRDVLYSNGRAKSNWVGDERDVLMTQARRHGFAVVDMQPVFASHWDRYRERMDWLPMDGHWNSVGHRLAADEVLKVIRAEAPAAAVAAVR